MSQVSCYPMLVGQIVGLVGSSSDSSPEGGLQNRRFFLRFSGKLEDEYKV